MSEPYLERLSRFTPDATRLDCDMVLFAAGRASVHPNRGWRVAACLLAVCQALTLALLWFKPMPPVGQTVEATNSPQSVSSAPAPADPAELGSLNRQLLESKDGELPPTASSENLAPNAPPLTVFASPVAVDLD
jgi:hypothetical protein